MSLLLVKVRELIFNNLIISYSFEIFFSRGT